MLKFKHKLGTEMLTENKEQLIELKISTKVDFFSKLYQVIFPADPAY